MTFPTKRRNTAGVVPNGRWSLVRGTTLRAARLGGVSIGLLCSGAGAAHAQQATYDGAYSTSSRDARGCSDTLQAANLTRVTIFQHASLRDTTPAVLAQVDLVAQRIAAAARGVLGARRDAIPSADSLGIWTRGVLRLPFVVVMRREQSGAWRSDTTSDTVSAKLVRLYEAVLRAIPPDSLWMIWPDGYSPESVAFRLTLTSGKGDPVRMAEQHSLFAVFSTRGILEQPALLRQDQAPARYPLDAIQHHISATVLLQFVVGADGRADASTLKVLRPSLDTIGASPFAHYYQEFVDAAETAVRNFRFYPARIGGCAARELVQFPFTFATPPRASD